MRWRRSAATLLDIGQLPNGGEIVGGGLQDIFELDRRLVVLSRLQQGSAKRDTRRQIRGVLGQTGAADADRLVELPGPAMLLRELRKSNRRRILLDPASKFFNPWIVRHEAYGMTIGLVVVALRPRLSVTVNLTL